MRKKIKKIISASGMAVIMIATMYISAIRYTVKGSKKDKKDERD